MMVTVSTLLALRKKSSNGEITMRLRSHFCAIDFTEKKHAPAHKKYSIILDILRLQNAA